MKWQNHRNGAQKRVCQGLGVADSEVWVTIESSVREFCGNGNVLYLACLKANVLFVTMQCNFPSCCLWRKLRKCIYNHSVSFYHYIWGSNDLKMKHLIKHIYFKCLRQNGIILGFPKTIVNVNGKYNITIFQLKCFFWSFNFRLSRCWKSLIFFFFFSFLAKERSLSSLGSY